MVTLLKDNEVLSFSFDDVNDSFSMICVQAKDLYIYIIDFINSTVITRVQDRNSIIRKSIFRHYHRRVRTLPKFEMMKEFIQDQESKGNVVLLPKLNQKFVIVYNKKSDLIQVYSILEKDFIRQFTLSSEDCEFGKLSYEHGSDGGKVSKNLASDSDRLSGFQLKIPASRLSVSNASASSPANDRNKSAASSPAKQEPEPAAKLPPAHIVEISPNGSLLIQVKNDQVFIMLIQTAFFESKNRQKIFKDEKMATFLPIYFDEDYNAHFIRHQYENAKKHRKAATCIDSRDHSTECDLTLKNVQKACKTFQQYLKLNTSMFSKSDIMMELSQFVPQAFVNIPLIVNNLQRSRKGKLNLKRVF